MKNTKLLSVILAAGVAGVALARFSNATFLAAVPGDKLFAVAVSLALAAFALSDYSRRIQPLSVKSPMLRPSLPSAVVARPPASSLARCSATRARTAA